MFILFVFIYYIYAYPSKSRKNQHEMFTLRIRFSHKKPCFCSSSFHGKTGFHPQRFTLRPKATSFRRDTRWGSQVWCNFYITKVGPLLYCKCGARFACIIFLSYIFSGKKVGCNPSNLYMFGIKSTWKSFTLIYKYIYTYSF